MKISLSNIRNPRMTKSYCNSFCQVIFSANENLQLSHVTEFNCSLASFHFRFLYFTPSALTVYSDGSLLSAVTLVGASLMICLPSSSLVFRALLWDNVGQLKPIFDVYNLNIDYQRTEIEGELKTKDRIIKYVLSTS